MVAPMGSPPAIRRVRRRRAQAAIGPLGPGETLSVQEDPTLAGDTIIAPQSYIERLDMFKIGRRIARQCSVCQCKDRMTLRERLLVFFTVARLSSAAWKALALCRRGWLGTCSFRRSLVCLRKRCTNHS